MLMDLIKLTSADWLRQAERRLAWALDEISAMSVAGLADDLDGCERAFSRILSDTNIAFEALRGASRDLDNGAVSGRMTSDRKADPLLFYLWHARNVDVHHLLERRISSVSAYLSIVDERKALPFLIGATTDDERGNRLWAAALGVQSADQAWAKLATGYTPPDSHLESIGLRWVKDRAALSLLPFRYKNERDLSISVASPDSHLGTPIPNAADRASELAVDYYGRMLDTLQRAAMEKGLL